MNEKELLSICTKQCEISEKLKVALQEKDVNVKNVLIATVGLELNNLTRELLDKSLFERELSELFK
jgi:hypothetical protein